MSLQLPMRHVSGPFIALVLAGLIGTPAFAQSVGGANIPVTGPQVQPLPNPNDPAAMLSYNLKILAQNPYDVDALLNAGLGALAIGDPNAAIGFLARAEELSPRNGRVKAALGSALTMMEKPAEALRLFSEAQALGVPESQLAKDRGLAWDLSGDPKRAQKDYALALKYGRDDEVTRRFALSLGISGEKEAALKLLDPLIRRGDQAAWRARAFIFAMNGDMPEANKIVRAAIAPHLVPTMSGFLARLPGLNASQRAHAVNFGTMPATSAPQVVMADTSTAFRSVGNGTNAGLLPTTQEPRVVNKPTPVAATAESPRDRRKREKEERRLAKLAAKGKGNTPTARPTAALPSPKAAAVAPSAQPATIAAAQPPKPISSPPVLPKTPTAVAQPAPSPQPVAPSPNDPRVGRRVAEVDPNRMPPAVRDIVRPDPEKPASDPKVTVVDGAKGLPPPQPGFGADSAGAKPAASPSSVPAPGAGNSDAVLKPLASASPSLVKPEPGAAMPEAPSIKPQIPVPSAAVPNAPQPVVSKPLVVTPSTPVDPPPAPATGPKPAVAEPSKAISPNPTPAPAIVQPPASPIGTAPSLPVASTAQVVPSAAPVMAPVGAPPSSSTGISTGSATPAPTPASVSSPSAPTGPGLQGIVPSIAPPLVSAAATAPASTVPLPSSPAPITPAPAAPLPEQTKAEPPKTTEEQKGLGSIVSGLEVEEESEAGKLPTEAEFKAKQAAAKRKEEQEARQKADEKAKADALAKEKVEAAEEKRRETEAAKKKEADEAAEAKRHPSRIWVQVATGSNRSGLPITWRKLKEDAPKALAGLSAWTIPFRATNRLLVGPFKSIAEARAVVNKLSKEGVTATTWTSESGEEVSKLGGR